MPAAKETRVKFELTPKHPTRKVFDNVLYPDGYAYVKELPLDSAIGRFNTCSDVKIIFNDQYYPVTPENIEPAFNKVLIDEEAPEGIEAVEAAPRALVSFIDAVSPEDTFVGLTAKDIQDLDVENGEISGTLYYAKSTQFSSDASEQEGYYIYLTVKASSEEYEKPGWDIVNGRSPGQFKEDTDILFWLGKTPEEAGKKVIACRATRKEVEGAEPEIVYMDLKHVKFEEAKPVLPGEDDGEEE